MKRTKCKRFFAPLPSASANKAFVKPEVFDSRSVPSCRREVPGVYDWSGSLVLIVPQMWIGAMLFGYLHVKESSGSGAGFGGLTTLGILFGQYLAPDNDVIFSALYRVSSILFAIVVTLLVTYAVHRLLNRFEYLRFGES